MIRTFAVSLGILLAACSAPSGTDGGPSGGGAPSSGGGGGTVATTGGGSATGGGGATSGGGDGATGGGEQNPGPGLDGTACTAFTDCASLSCVTWFRDAGAVCGRACFDQTACDDLDHFVCNLALDGGGICVPRSPAHCLPCEFDVDCGGLSEACVLAPGDTRMSCRVDCSLAGAAACPADYTCTALRFNGAMRSFCMPQGRCADSQGGFCDRYPQPQPCSTTNDAGICTGTRGCVGERFSTCNALAPQCKASCGAADPAGCTLELCPSATQQPEHCGDCATACPGAGQTTTAVACTGTGCTFACAGENYDVDQSPDSGCELADAPLGNHTSVAAATQGSLSCSDSSTLNTTGLLPSDLRAHLPSIDGFSAVEGAAPDFLSVNGTGGTFCQNDIDLRLTVTGASTPACYRLTVDTDKGSYSCSTDSTGGCTVNEGMGSYSDDTTIVISVTRTCSAAAVDARYAVSGHF